MPNSGVYGQQENFGDPNDPPDVPLFTPQDILRQIWLYRLITDTHVCSGGGFFYLGRDFKLGPLHLEAVVLVTYDPEAGGSHSTILGGGVGPLTIGQEWSRNWRGWKQHSEPIGLGGGHAGKVELGGIYQPTPAGTTIGGYGGIGIVGVGGYGDVQLGPCTGGKK